MQASQVKQDFPRIERSVDHAAQLCQTANQVPEQLRSCIAQLDQETDKAKQMLDQQANDNRIIECIDRLEKLSDQAMQACKQQGNAIDSDVANAVKQAHAELSDMKHRLH